MFIYGIEGYIDDTRGDTCVFQGVSAEEGQSSGGEDEERCIIIQKREHKLPPSWH